MSSSSLVLDGVDGGDRSSRRVRIFVGLDLVLLDADNYQLIDDVEELQAWAWRFDMVVERSYQSFSSKCFYSQADD